MAKASTHAIAEPATGVPIRHYRPELDVVRFLAFLGVFLHHSILRSPSITSPWRPAIANACGFGLCLFFVLSAYLISDLLMRERAHNGDIDISAFFQRRIRRIWPLYLFGLVLGEIWSIVTHQPAGARFLVYFFLAGNWYCIFHGWSNNPLTALWSISIEEQFYLLWPAVARYATRRTMAVVCVALLILANAFLFHLGATHADLEITVWANTFVQFEMFATGILIALALKQKMPRLHWPLRVMLLLACPLLWYSAVYYFHAKELGPAVSATTLITGYALGALGSAALLVGLLGVNKSSVPRWLAYLGRISYGLYVYHMLAKQLVRHFGVEMLGRHFPFLLRGQIVTGALLAFGITIAMAAVSYKYFEEPFLRKRPARI